MFCLPFQYLYNSDAIHRYLQIAAVTEATEAAKKMASMAYLLAAILLLACASCINAQRTLVLLESAVVRESHSNFFSMLSGMLIQKLIYHTQYISGFFPEFMVNIYLNIFCTCVLSSGYLNSYAHSWDEDCT